MSNPGGREMVFCFRCEEKWYRDQHGLTCPHCHSDFVEVIEADNNPHEFLHGAQGNEEQWTPIGSAGPPEFGGFGTFGSAGFPFSQFPPPQQQPANRAGPDFRYQEHRSPGGGMVFTSFSYNTTGNRGTPVDAHAQIMNSFGGMMQGILGNIQATRQGGLDGDGAPPPFMRSISTNGPQQPHHHVVDPYPAIWAHLFPPPTGLRTPPGPQTGSDDNLDGLPPNPLMGLMRMILSGHPIMTGGGHGDAAYSQEEFDRIMSQLLEQAQQGGGQPPASQQDIASIPRVTIDQGWLDSNQEHKDCTICMEEAKLGDDINELWCGHWYHPDCIKMWLDNHDQCPLCRKTLEQGRQEAEARESKSSKRERRHSTRAPSYSPWRGGDSGSSGGGGSGGDAGNGASIRDRFTNLFRGSSR